MAIETLMLERFRAVRGDLAELKDGQRELVEQIIGLRFREHAKDGDLVRHDRQIAKIQADIDQIKRRLDLVDADD